MFQEKKRKEKRRERRREKKRRERENEGTNKYFINEGNGISTILFYI